MQETGVLLESIRRWRRSWRLESNSDAPYHFRANKVKNLRPRQIQLKLYLSHHGPLVDCPKVIEDAYIVNHICKSVLSVLFNVSANGQSRQKKLIKALLASKLKRYLSSPHT